MHVGKCIGLPDLCRFVFLELKSDDVASVSKEIG